MEFFTYLYMLSLIYCAVWYALFSIVWDKQFHSFFSKTVVGCAAIHNAAIRNYMAAILRHSPTTTVFFLPLIEMCKIHTWVHCYERLRQTLFISWRGCYFSVSVIFTSSAHPIETHTFGDNDITQFVRWRGAQCLRWMLCSKNSLGLVTSHHLFPTCLLFGSAVFFKV